MSAEEIEMTNTDESQETIHKLEGHVIVLEWAVGALLAMQFAAHRDGFLERISQLTLEADKEGDLPDGVKRGFEKAKIVLAEQLRGLSDDVLRKALQAGVTITIGRE